MADDYIEEMQNEAKERFGKTLSPSEAAAEFEKHDFETRIHHLKTLKDAGSFASPLEAAERYVYVKALRDTHHRLREINR